MRNNASEGEVYQVPATDIKGHSVQRILRITPQMAMQIEIYVASRRWPYRTEAELIRHAIVRHLGWMDRNSQGEESLVPHIRQTAKAVSMQEQQDEFTGMVEKVVRIVESLVSGGNADKARVMLQDVYRQVEEIIKKDEYWGKKYKKSLDARLSSIPGIRVPSEVLKPSKFVDEDNE